MDDGEYSEDEPEISDPTRFTHGSFEDWEALNPGDKQSDLSIVSFAVCIRALRGR